MKPANGPTSGALRCLYEISLSGTVASAFMTKLVNSNEIHWNAQFFGWQMGLNYSLHRRYNDPLGTDLAFYIWSLALALVIFSLLRLFARFSWTTRMLRTISGVLVVAAPPTCLWVVGEYRPAEPLWGWHWLRLEGSAAIGCAVLYACNRWPISTRITATLLALHGALWLHAYAVTFDAFGFCWLTVPIVAFVSTLMWGRFAGQYRQNQNARWELPWVGRENH